VSQDSIRSGRVQKAPESFLSRTGIKEVFAEGKKGRRDFIRNAFAAAAAGMAAPVAMAQGNPVPSEGGDTNILNLPEHATGLGQGVATEGYGKPSKFEANLQFIECGANTAVEWGNVAVPTVQYTHGMLSCSEFTGVPLITLLELAGADLKNGKFVLAEGGEGSSMTRTIPMSLITSGEVIVAYGQNGEMLRPENGYPLRLVVPGVQGVSWIKYLRRVEVGDKPYAAKDEAIHYMDLQPGGQHRQYSNLQEVKSVVTTPSGGQVLLDKGFYNITGLAWSGKGKIKRVDVSADGGRNWRQARLETPVMSKALSRFNLDWVWDGKPAILQSRAQDETGHVQPTYQQLRAVRGTRSIYHNNAIQSWLVQENGEVKNVQVS